jgi:hypothetical protein
VISTCKDVLLRRRSERAPAGELNQLMDRVGFGGTRLDQSDTSPGWSPFPG